MHLRFYCTRATAVLLNPSVPHHSGDNGAHSNMPHIYTRCPRTQALRRFHVRTYLSFLVSLVTTLRECGAGVVPKNGPNCRCGSSETVCKPSEECNMADSTCLTEPRVKARRCKDGPNTFACECGAKKRACIVGEICTKISSTCTAAAARETSVPAEPCQEGIVPPGPHCLCGASQHACSAGLNCDIPAEFTLYLNIVANLAAINL